MKFTDYIALARAGYKKADIEKMIAEDAKEEKDPLPDPLDIGESPNPEPELPTQQTSEAEKPASDQTDYKALYEELKKENEKTKKNLEEAQRANISRDNSDNVDTKSGYEKLKDLFR